MKYFLIGWVTCGIVPYIQFFTKISNGKFFDALFGLVLFSLLGPFVFVDSFYDDFVE
jgi:hypothetical protein